ncbi:MAG: DNA-deoxyinosine glycosylase [Acetanaerobacterium sp.]
MSGADRSYVTHAFEPVYDEQSRILLLGTMPSPKSRENGYYYSHPQNRFWRVMAAVLCEEEPQTTQQKRTLLISHHIALWDVLASCEITGASDTSIKNPVSNDLRVILDAAPVAAVFATGRKAESLYNRLCRPPIGMEIVYLPSTSPANRARNPDDALVLAYSAILPYLL